MNRISRRQAIGILAGGALAARAPLAQAQPAQSLGAIAAQKGYVFGASAGREIFADAGYREIYETQTKIITTDNALKVSTIAPQPGPKHFESADRLLAFCDSRRIPMRGHCLMWNEWVPAWIKAMSKGERQKFFDAYIDEVVARYAGRLHSWDVVNEPFWPGHRAPGGYRMGAWYDAYGPDYVRRAFVRAARADPKVRLVLNEAQTERDDDLGKAVRQGMLRLVAELKNAGVKLDVVGLQGHLQPQVPHDPGRFSEFVHALANFGVDIYFTEFDVRDDIFADEIQQRDAQVAGVAGRFLATVLPIPAVKAVICWQLGDRYSFYRGIARQKNPLAARLPRPLPYDDQLRRKPFWYAIAQSFAGARRESEGRR